MSESNGPFADAAGTTLGRDLGGSDRNLALELVRVTEAAAMAAARRMGCGDKEATEIRAAGARIAFTFDGDVAGAIMAARPDTGITDGALLRGVRCSGRGATTQSLSMRSSSGTVRTVNAEHTFSKCNAIARFAALDELAT